MKALLFALVSLLIASAAGQSFCEKYALGLFGPPLGQAEISLINATIEYAFGQVYTNPSTKDWFNGMNNGIDYGAATNAVAAQTLKNHLIGFFGFALGCTDPVFNATYGPGTFQTNMTAVHTGFTQPINKAAYETFNQIVIQFLQAANVSTADQIAVATALDIFRARPAAGVNNNQVCQAMDCTTSPYTVNVDNDFFNPPYVTVPNGVSVAFTKVSATAGHTATAASNGSQCVYNSLTAAFDLTFTATAIGTTQTTPPLTAPGLLPYLSVQDCNVNGYQSMYGVVNVLPGPPTFCQKYSAALFGADNVTTEIALLNTTVLAAFGALYADPITKPWFNGSNNIGNIDFGSNVNASAGLVSHLIAYFGFALGCIAPGFSTAYPVNTVNMTAAHSGFAVPINKAAYERFNQILLDFLARVGVTPADVFSVATTLDGFRTKPATGPNTNQVCQGPDCTMAPYTVLLSDGGGKNFFNPSYITVPTGGSIQFVKQGSGAHSATQAQAPSGTCMAASSPSFDFDFSSNPSGSNFTTTAFNQPGEVDYFSKTATDCNVAGMYGAINVVGAPVSTTTFCQKYSAALFGADNVTTEIALLNTTVLAAFGALYADPITKPWFNGSNNIGNIDFGSNVNASAGLVSHLIAYFGFALGCIAPGFSTAYPVNTVNMTAAHSGFAVPINKAAYERFNQILLDFLARVGVTPADVFSVATTLDGFRTKPATGPNTNQVCQGPDCTTAPYIVLLSDGGGKNFFNPSYITVPTGGSIQFVKQGSGAHSATQAQSPAGTCTAASTPLFDFDFSTNPSGSNFTTTAFNQPGEVDYFSKTATDCNVAGMYGAINVVGAAVAAPTFCQKYAAAVYGADNLANEIALINGTVLYAFGQLYADPATKGWFNGTNNGAIDFGTNSAAAAALVKHLIGFFGSALGCTAPGFAAQFAGFQTNMTSVHTGFVRPINKAAYERFNQIILDYLNIAGCSPADIYSVAITLDSFRSKPASGPNPSQVCQASDCNSSPFTVVVNDNYFNPSFISVPVGVRVAFEDQSAAAHTIVSTVGAAGSCALQSSNPAVNIFISASASTGTTFLAPLFAGQGNVNYADSVTCASRGLYGTLNYIAPVPTSLTFCQKYATAVYGADNLANEIALINGTVLYAFGQLYADPATKGWFNGTNNGAIDFGTNSAAAAALVKHLIGFFGSALGCTAPGFAAQFAGFQTNMTSVHTGFVRPINKAAYERFNQIIIDYLAAAGVSAADRVTVASVLDGFRAKPASGANNAQVCQASDCTTAPYQMLVQDNYFNPPYLTVPINGQVQFVKQAGLQHTIVQSVSPVGQCSIATTPTFNATLAAGAANGTAVDTGTSLNTAGTVNVISDFSNDCLLNGMYATLMVMPAASTATVIVGVSNNLRFSPSTLSLVAPATITFMWDAANTRSHTVTSQTIGSPCVPGGIQPFNSGSPQSSGMFTVVLTNSGTYPFYCEPHCSANMTGVITITGGPTAPPPGPPPPPAPTNPPPPPGAAQIIVGGSGTNRFTPNSLVVTVGQQVNFLWAADNTGSHNIVQEATPGACTAGGPAAGALMPAGTTTVSTPGNLFTKTFTAAGNYYFFCEPHCFSGMEGVISVVVPGGTTAPLASTAPPAPPTPTSNNTNPNCYTNPDGVMTICWKVMGDSIWFQVKGKTTGWIATGISDDNLMPQSDIFWGQVDSLGPVIVDRYADQRAQPPMDAQQDLKLDAANSGEANGVTTLTFTRLLKTVPADNRDIDITDRSLFLLWAYSDKDATRVRTRDGTQPDMFSFQQHLRSGPASVNLFSGAASSAGGPVDKLRKAHAILMILAWGLCAVVGTFIARFYKNLMGGGWFQSHRIIQFLCVILNLIAFILIMVWVTRQKQKHFRAPHQRLGLVIMILSILQPVLGVLADKLFDPKRKRVPFFPDILHWVFGYGVVILGLVNIWLGLSIYCVTHLAALFYALLTAVIIFGFFAFEMTKLLAPWGSFLGGHGSVRGQPSTVLAIAGAVLAILLAVFVAVIAAEVGKENSAAPDPYYKGCVVPILGGSSYWIRLTIYLSVGAAAAVVCLITWIWRGKKAQSYEIALEGGALYHALDR